MLGRSRRLESAMVSLPVAVLPFGGSWFKGTYSGWIPDTQKDSEVDAISQ